MIRARKTITIMLSIIMACTVMSVPAFAADDQAPVSADSDTAVSEEIQSEEIPAEEIPAEEEVIDAAADIPAVTDVKVTADKSGNAEITWTAVPGVTGYEIFRSAEKTDEGSYETVGRVEGVTSFSDSGLADKTVYLYMVRAFVRDSAGTETYGPFSKAALSTERAVKIPVITYHRICKDSAFSRIRQGKSQFVKEGVFAKEMKYLKDKGYRTISTGEFYQWYSRNIELPEKVVLITFDDGNYSVIKYGLPVLKKNKQKATIFMIGYSTRSTTRTSHYSADSYWYIGKDVMKKVKKSYPDLEFQSHTYKLHSRINGRKPVEALSEAKLYQDAVTQYSKFKYTALAYPWGTTNNKMKRALKKEGHIKVAFTYGANAYARRSNDQYKVRRIKIYGTQPYSYFTRWF